MSRLPRTRLLLFASLAMLVIPAILLSVLALRLLADFEGLERRSLQHFGETVAGVAAERFERQLWEDEQNVLGALRLNPPRDVEAVVGILPALATSYPLYDTAFFVAVDGEVRWHPDLEQRSELVPRVVEAAEAWSNLETEGPRVAHHVSGEAQGAPFQATILTVRGPGQDMLGSAVLVWDLAFVRTTYVAQYLTAELPAGYYAGKLGAGQASVSLLDAGGGRLYETSPPRGELVAVRPLAEVLEFWSIGVDLDDAEFESWMSRVRLTHWALVLGMLVIIIVGAVLLARWFEREVEYAALKTSFVSNVSHELKTPLSLIRLYAETLELGRAADADKQREFLRVISREANRLTHLIDRVLDVSRTDSGQERYDRREADIGRIVRDTLDAYQPRFDEHGTKVTRELDAGSLPGRVDAEAITRALINLLDNAVKYSNGDPRIRVILRRDADRALIAIEDRGVGIPTNEQRRVFDVFYRVERGSVHNVKGLGLGLSMVRHIIEAHDGTVRVDSVSGEGSTFSITLPLIDGGRAE